MRKLTTILWLVLAGLTSIVNATPVVDGRFDAAEGYSTGNYLEMSIEKTGPISDKGQLWYYQDKVNKDLYVALIQPLSLVDNTYGANAIGWGKNVAPSGKSHSFSNLVGSDCARFTITDKSGNTLFDFTLDYISASKNTPSGYASLGVGGGDGKVHSGLANSMLDFGTSLDYNFNTKGYVLTQDSPATDKNYTENPNFPGWVFEDTYEFKVDGSLFAKNGFGGVSVPLIHDSPNKIGDNKIYTKLDGVLPEPMTLVTLGLGSLVLSRRRRA